MTRISQQHHQDDMESRGFCAWGKKHRLECYEGIHLPEKPTRVVLGEVVNEARIRRDIDDSATW
jgi:hypothetical protein